MIAVDLFAGLGGFTEGAERSGVRVTWAANHWPAAVEIHAKNHPGTKHSCQEAQQMLAEAADRPVSRYVVKTDTVIGDPLPIPGPYETKFTCDVARQ